VELGGLSRDTVELRDGTMLLGDVVSVSLTSVVVRVDGKEATYARNRIKKITCRWTRIDAAAMKISLFTAA
jgi:hypothetical protein